MTENEWLGASDVELTTYVDRRAAEDSLSKRKACLFYVACLRRVWTALDEESGRLAVTEIEWLADEGDALRETDHDPWLAALTKAEDAGTAAWMLAAEAAHVGEYATPILNAKLAAGFAAHQFALLDHHCVGQAKEAAAWLRVTDVQLGSEDPGFITGWEEETQQQATFVRCIFGNPFRPTVIDHSWLSLTVTGLAAAVYDDRQLPSGLFDNQRLAVLADALEDAGCDTVDILSHLRNGGDHVRGCWVIDLLLGKE